MFRLNMSMQINSISQIPYNQKSPSKNVSFEGLRKVINAGVRTAQDDYLTEAWLTNLFKADSVQDFLQKIKILGDTTIMKRVEKGNRVEFVPEKVSVVKAVPNGASDRDSNFYFGLFEKGFEKAKTVEELDSKELGLIEVQYKDVKHMHFLFGEDSEARSDKVLKRVYDKALKVHYLISYEGDKYKGIGTKLLDLAVDKSKQMGLGGKVFLFAENDFPGIYLKQSDYCNKRKLATPTIFYHNYGFISAPSINRAIKDAIEFKCSAPQGFTMYLPQKSIKQINQRLKNAPIMDVQA